MFNTNDKGDYGMSEKVSTQKGNSNTNRNSSSSNKSKSGRYGSLNESAVHKPVPGRGGKNK